ncbi:hypothetical protein [Nocardioides sp.]
MSTPTPVSIITDGVDGLSDNLLTIAGVGVGIGAVVLAVRKGWGLVKKFF